MSLCSIVEISLTDQSENKVIYKRHTNANLANGHASNILFEYQATEAVLFFCEINCNTKFELL